MHAVSNAFDSLPLSRMAKRLLARTQNDATAAKGSAFFARHIAPMTLREGQWFVPFLPNKYHRREPNRVREVLAKGSFNELCWTSPFFANPLSMSPDSKLRLVNAGCVILTVEFDPKTLFEFEEQLSWFDRGGSFAAFDEWLRGYKDYRGYCAAYSGHKSVHIHLAFDTKHLSRGLAQGSRDACEAIADVSSEQFARMSRAATAHIREMARKILSAPRAFDAAPDSPAQLRRTAWAWRIAGYKNLLGISPGMPVRQGVLLEKPLGKSLGGSRPYLFSAELHATCAAYGSDRPLTSVNGSDMGDLNCLIPQIWDVLRAEWQTDYPKPCTFRRSASSITLHFANSPDDKNPSSIIGWCHNQLLQCGRDEHPHRKFHLPSGLSLAEFVSMFPTPPDRDVFEPHGLDALDERAEHDAGFVSRYGMRAPWWAPITLGDRRGEFRRIIAPHLARHSVVIRAEEGLGKSSALADLLVNFEHRPFLDQQFGSHFDWTHSTYFDPARWASASSGFLAFAARSKEQGKKQVQDYNARLTETGVRKQLGVWMPSLREDYEEACARLGAEPLAEIGFHRAGSRLELVRKVQPHVLRDMVTEKNRRWRKIMREVRTTDIRQLQKRLLMFTTHAALHHDALSTEARIWRHPQYQGEGGRLDSSHPLHAEMPFSRSIQDEIELSDLIDVIPAERVRAYVRAGRNLSKSARHPDIFEVFEQDVSSMGLPGASFDEFKLVIQEPFAPEHSVSIPSMSGFGRANGPTDAYKRLTGREYYVRPRRWMRISSASVIASTTEAVPADVAEKCGWGVVDVTRRDNGPPVLLYLDNRACKSRITELVGEIRSHRPDWHVITDFHRGPDVTTHQGARGRNDLRTVGIVTVLTWPSPDHVGEMRAIARYLNIQPFEKRFLSDRLHQAIGRNRGHRAPSTAAPHVVVMGWSLYRQLGGDEWRASLRYRAEPVFGTAPWLTPP